MADEILPQPENRPLAEPIPLYVPRPGDTRLLEPYIDPEQSETNLISRGQDAIITAQLEGMTTSSTPEIVMNPNMLDNMFLNELEALERPDDFPNRHEIKDPALMEKIFEETGARTSDRVFLELSIQKANGNDVGRMHYTFVDGEDEEARVEQMVVIDRYINKEGELTAVQTTQFNRQGNDRYEMQDITAGTFRRMTIDQSVESLDIIHESKESADDFYNETGTQQFDKETLLKKGKDALNPPILTQAEPQNPDMQRALAQYRDEPATPSESMAAMPHKQQERGNGFSFV